MTNNHETFSAENAGPDTRGDFGNWAAELNNTPDIDAENPGDRPYNPDGFEPGHVEAREAMREDAASRTTEALGDVLGADTEPALAADAQNETAEAAPEPTPPSDEDIIASVDRARASLRGNNTEAQEATSEAPVDATAEKFQNPSDFTDLEADYPEFYAAERADAANTEAINNQPIEGGPTDFSDFKGQAEATAEPDQPVPSAEKTAEATKTPEADKEAALADRVAAIEARLGIKPESTSLKTGEKTDLAMALERMTEIADALLKMTGRLAEQQADLEDFPSPSLNTLSDNKDKKDKGSNMLRFKQLMTNANSALSNQYARLNAYAAKKSAEWEATGNQREADKQARAAEWQNRVDNETPIIRTNPEAAQQRRIAEAQAAARAEKNSEKPTSELAKDKGRLKKWGKASVRGVARGAAVATGVVGGAIGGAVNGAFKEGRNGAKYMNASMNETFRQRDEAKEAQAQQAQANANRII